MDEKLGLKLLVWTEAVFRPPKASRLYAPSNKRPPRRVGFAEGAAEPARDAFCRPFRAQSGGRTLPRVNPGLGSPGPSGRKTGVNPGLGSPGPSGRKTGVNPGLGSPGPSGRKTGVTPGLRSLAPPGRKTAFRPPVALIRAKRFIPWNALEKTCVPSGRLKRRPGDSAPASGPPVTRCGDRSSIRNGRPSGTNPTRPLGAGNRTIIGRLRWGQGIDRK